MAARRRDVVIRAVTAPAGAGVLEPAVWLTHSFAEAWFKDACREAETVHDSDSRRRQILFAVCFIESYLYEWVRDGPLRDSPDELRDYFPTDDRRGIYVRWKEVLKDLRRKEKIERLPNVGGPPGVDWKRLLAYRNGLVHALASRHQTTARPKEEMPVPPKTELERLHADWAVRVVVDRVQRLHKAVGGSPPPWLAYP